MADVGTLADAAAKRKERLLAMKNRGQNNDGKGVKRAHGEEALPR